jgi:hypothetical protein
MKTFADFVQEYRLAPGVTAVVVDVVGLVREEIKQSIPDAKVREYLPFATSIVEGSTHFHIKNDSVYDVDTKYHTIEQGDTLCARGGDNSNELRYVVPTCPGCIAKAKNIIASHLLAKGSNPSEGI